MKFLKAILPFVLYFLGGNRADAQWYKLPYPPPPPGWYNASCPGGSHIPYENLNPEGNGVIIYDFICKGGSSGSYGISESQNDLGKDTGVFGYDDIGCCYNDFLSSFNDSTYAFIINFGGSSYVYYTTSNFSVLKSMNTVTFDIGGPIALTRNLIYLAIQDNFMNSLIVSQTVISSNTSSYVSLNSDSIAGKFLFANDSTGFILTYQKAKPATNVLIKTSNYAITWNNIYHDSTNNITDYCFPTKDTGYVLMTNDNAYQTTNGGTTWNKLPVPAGNYACIQFANGQIGYLGGKSGLLIKTTNGGIAWVTDTTKDSLHTIKSIYTFGTSLVYFVDSANYVYKNQPLVSTAQSKTSTSDTLSDKINLFPNPNNGKFCISLPAISETYNLEIYDDLGQKIYTGTLFSGDNNIILNPHQNGIFLYKVLNLKSGLITKGKFIVD